jgi:hypothetical protein
MTDGRDLTDSAAIATAGVLATLCALAVGPAYINHDVAWYLHVVERWLAGAVLYRDVIDTNPPLITWLTAPAVAIAQAAGWPPTAVFKVGIFALGAAAIVVTRRLLAAQPAGRRFVGVAVVAFLCLPFVKEDFGQREHIAVLLTLPYVLAVATPGTRWRGLRILIGVAAGIGFSIKPHFALAWIAVTLQTAAVKGVRDLWRAEVLAVPIVMGLYGAAVLALTPEYLPIVDRVRQVYGGLDAGAAALIRIREVQLWLLVLAVMAAIRWPRDERLPVALFAAASGYLLGALLQEKGWSYHLYPARVFTLLSAAAAATVVLDLVPGLGAVLRGGRRGLAVVLASVLIVGSLRYVAEARRPARPDLVTPLVAAIHQYAPDGPVLVLGMRTIFYPGFPAVNYAGARWSSRHSALWFLPAFYAEQAALAGGPLVARRPAEMSALEATFFAEIIEDLCADPPRLLLVENPLPAAPAGRRALDLLAYYRQDERVMGLLNDYREAGTIGPFTLHVAEPGAHCR